MNCSNCGKKPRNPSQTIQNELQSQVMSLFGCTISAVSIMEEDPGGLLVKVSHLGHGHKINKEKVKKINKITTIGLLF